MCFLIRFCMTFHLETKSEKVTVSFGVWCFFMNIYVYKCLFIVRPAYFTLLLTSVEEMSALLEACLCLYFTAASAREQRFISINFRNSTKLISITILFQFHENHPCILYIEGRGFEFPVNVYTETDLLWRVCCRTWLPISSNLVSWICMIIVVQFFLYIAS